MRLLYTFFIIVYGLIIRMISPFNEKARLWIKGRRASREKIKSMQADGRQWLWFHAASLGEFEQGRTVIEAVRRAKPEYGILLTFFSPSGYEIRKNYEHADLVLYLPEDRFPLIEDFCNRFNIRAVFFIKYEFWYNLLDYLNKKNIPFYFFSVRFRPSQHFFKGYGAWFLHHLRPARHIFVQDETSFELLTKNGISQCSIAGDTRFDRVAQLAKKAERLPEIEDFAGQNPIFVAGSTWPADEKLLLPLLSELPDNYKVILAPHDISRAHVDNILGACPFPAVRYSERKPNAAARILVIDNVGMLSRIYRYARFAYIGGGFGKAIHNIQEPVAWGCPVIFGPNHQKFTEAVDLLQLGGAIAVNNSAEMKKAMLRFAANEMAREESSAICLAYVDRNLGATDLILQNIGL